MLLASLLFVGGPVDPVIGAPAPQDSPEQSKQPQTSVVAKIPFKLVKQHIIVNATVNGSRPLSFILDTGDTLGIIDLDLARELGLKLTGDVAVDGIGSKAAASRQVQGATYLLTGLDGRPQPIVLAIPLHKLLSSRLGQDMDGIIGGDFMRQYVVEIDYAASVVTLHNKDTFTYAGPGESIPLEFDKEGQPLIRGQVTPVGGKPIPALFKLDTGAQHAVALHGPFVREHNLPGDIPSIDDMRTGGVGGESSSKMARLDELKIGKLAFHRPQALFAFDTEGSFGQKAFQGNIGAHILTRFRVFLDYSHKRVILEARPGYADPFDRVFAGLGVEAEGKDYRTFRVKFVQANSAAAAAGVQPEDVIAAIDDKPAATFSLSELMDQMQKPATFRLTLRRGEQDLHASITPRTLD
jgi:hypothetical protein